MHVRTSLLFGTSTSLSRIQTKTKLMLCKPLFIIHVRAKGLFKVILEYKTKALVQINEVLLYNKL